MTGRNRIDGYRQVRKGWHDFGNGRRFYFKSLWELNIARYLEWLRLRGDIEDWQYEPDTFWFPVKRGTTNYKPDFRVVENTGAWFYIEVKGYMNARSKTALQRMKKHHPTVDLRLYDGPVYRSIVKDWGHLFGATEEWIDAEVAD